MPLRRLRKTERRGAQEVVAAFFGGLHGVLNHLLVGGRIWLARLHGHDAGIERLDVALYEDFEVLRAARTARISWSTSTHAGYRRTISAAQSGAARSTAIPVPTPCTSC